MKTKSIILLLLAPMLAFGQIKGKKSKNSVATFSGKEYKIGDYVTLAKASNNDKYAFAYVNKSMLSLKNITKAVNAVKDAKNMDIKNVNQLANNLETVSKLANSEIVSGAMAQLIGQVVSENYVAENALDTSMSGSKYKIKSFKVFTDKASGQSIVHAITKGNGKSVAILLEFAEKSGEI